MKKIPIILGICLSLTFDSAGQQVRGKVFINGEQFLSNSDTSTYFTFRPLKAKLSKQGRMYLDNFANYFISSQKQSDSLRIVIDPASTFKEQKVIDSQIGFARACAVHDYLEKKYGIEIGSVTIRETRTVCILTGTINRTKNGKRD